MRAARRSAVTRPVMADHADGLMQRRAPHLRAARSAAADADMTAARSLRGSALAWVPADSHGAWPPGMVQAALHRYARPDWWLPLGHALIQTCDRAPS